MAKCENCLHNEVCKYGENRSNGIYCTGEKCKQFKDRTKYEEVVRCKDCKHFNMREMECQNEAVSTDHEGGASYSLNFDLDDFCSYGERKDNE